MAEVFGKGATFYGLSPSGVRRCTEDDILRMYEPAHPYERGFVTLNDGTRMAITQAKAREAGWNDLAEMMAARGKR